MPYMTSPPLRSGRRQLTLKPSRDTSHWETDAGVMLFFSSIRVTGRALAQAGSSIELSTNEVKQGGGESGGEDKQGGYKRRVSRRGVVGLGVVIRLTRPESSQRTVKDLSKELRMSKLFLPLRSAMLIS
ncbi:hypothetical protein L2E82_28342 [Cichorium intybus]|uniref:Uncharacterized protein n=1 Tax=Cichorium intybus TaxID=13427 RepID=A0ACB9CVJ9_CICIN|nr:hypothetical protein L2E82_28342 [Cichorium intybus]